MKPKIVVIGSANTDMIVTTNKIPTAGETILGDRLMQSLGGKGANQAVAAARLGADVTFIARLGKDHFGQDALEVYAKEGINTKHIVQDENEPTGIALIMIDSQGENIICVAPGANAKLSTIDISRAEEAIKSADCVLLQLEIPIKAVEFAIELASEHHVQVILNPAPMTTLSKELLGKVDLLTPNKTEAAALIRDQTSHPTDLALKIKREFGIKYVIITMGKKGAILLGLNSPSPTRISSFPVKSVDTTGAGDAFNGGLAVALARGENMEDAVKYANAVGALATTRFGAQSSLPTMQEVKAFLERQAAKVR
ncbi:MAG: ribokinase [Anaerolineales bacterium]